MSCLLGVSQTCMHFPLKLFDLFTLCSVLLAALFVEVVSDEERVTLFVDVVSDEERVTLFVDVVSDEERVTLFVEVVSDEELVSSCH